MEADDIKIKQKTNELSNQVAVNKRKCSRVLQPNQVRLQKLKEHRSKSKLPNLPPMRLKMATKECSSNAKSFRMNRQTKSKRKSVNVHEIVEKEDEQMLFCNSSLIDNEAKSTFIRYKTTNIYLHAKSDNCLSNNTILEKMFNEDNFKTPASIDTVSDHLVDYVIKTASEEYLDVADAVWMGLQELVMEGVNIQLQTTLDMRCRIRLHRRSDDTLIKWIASRSSQSAICLVMNGLMHLLRMNRLPNSALLVSLAARSRQMVVDSVWEELHRQLPNRSDSVLRHLWRECIRMVKHHLDVYVKTTTLSWIRDRSPTLAGIPSGHISPCRAALLITASGIVLEVCQSELMRYFVTSSNVPKEKFEDLVRVILLLPRPLLYSMSAWIDSHLWFLVNKIVRLPSTYHIRRVVLSVVSQVMKHAHAQVRKALPEKHNQISEDLFVDGIVDYIISYLQQKLLVHSMGTKLIPCPSEKLLKKITTKANEICGSVFEKLETENQDTGKRTLAKKLSDLVIETSVACENVTLEERMTHHCKWLHKKNMNQIITAANQMAESLASEGTVPQKNLLAEMGFNIASQAATMAVQDLGIDDDNLTPYGKCRIFLEYTCSDLREIIWQKGVSLLDKIAKVNEMTQAVTLQKIATTFVLELELLHDVSDKLDEILEADRQDSLRRTIESYPVHMCKLDELVEQEKNWVVDGIVSAVKIEVDSLLKNNKIPCQQNVSKFVNDSIINLLPEAINELELKLRYLFETSSVTSGKNLNFLMKELASHVFYESCIMLSNEARKEQVAGEACVSGSATFCRGEMKMQTSNEVYTAMKNRRLGAVIVEIQNDIARQVVKVVEEETVMINIGRLDIDTMEKMDELAFSIVMRIIQIVEEDINSAGPDLIAVWESPLLERILREAARLLRCWENENKLVIDALGVMISSDTWFISCENACVNYNGILSNQQQKLNSLDVTFTSTPKNLIPEESNKNEGDKTSKADSDSNESIAFLEEQVVHGIVNRILTTQILSVFESKLTGVAMYLAESGDETHCICSEEDRQFIWDITSLVFPLSSLREAEEVEKLHLSVHKFAHSIFSSTAPWSKMALDEDELELLHIQLVTIIQNVLSSKSVQSQLVLDTMSSVDSLNALNAVVITESTRILMREISSHYDRTILSVFEQARDEIVEYVRRCTVNHFPLISQNLTSGMVVTAMDTRAMNFDDASGQLVTSLVDDVRECVFTMVDELAEFKKSLDAVKENVKQKVALLSNLTGVIEQYLNKDRDELENNVEACDEKIDDANLVKKQAKTFQVHDVLYQVRTEVRKQLINTRMFVSCLVRMARKHMRDTATKLKNKMRLDSCFYVYEILPPSLDSVCRDNSGLNLRRGRSLHSAISNETTVERASHVPQKIVSLDAVNRDLKMSKSFPKFRSLDDISPPETLSTGTGSTIAETRLNPSTAKSHFSLDREETCPEFSAPKERKNATDHDNRSKAMSSSIECFLTQQMIKTSMIVLKETYLNHNWSSGGDGNQVKDTITDVLLKQVVDNLKQEVFVRDLVTNSVGLQQPKPYTSTSLPSLSVALNDVLKETLNNLVSHVESHDVKSGNQVDTMFSAELTPSQDLLVANTLSQARRFAIKSLSVKPDSKNTEDALEKNSKMLARKIVKQGKILLNDSKQCLTLKDLLEKIVSGVQEEMNRKDGTNRKSKSVSLQIRYVTNEMLKKICQELQSDSLVDEEIKSRKLKLKLNCERRVARKSKAKNRVCSTPLSKLPQLVHLEGERKMEKEVDLKTSESRSLSNTSDSTSSTIGRNEETYTCHSSPRELVRFIIKRLRDNELEESSIEDDLRLQGNLEEIISALNDELKEVKHRVEKSKPQSGKGNPGPKRKPSFSSVKPLIESDATSSADIFEAVLDLVTSNAGSSSIQKGEDPDYQSDTSLSASSSVSTAKLKPIFEGEEINMDQSDIEMGLSAISLKNPDISSLNKQEISARNSFRNLLAPDMATIPVAFNEYGGGSQVSNDLSSSQSNKSLTKIKCLIKRAAHLQKTFFDVKRSSSEENPTDDGDSTIQLKKSTPKSNTNDTSNLTVQSLPQEIVKEEDGAGPSSKSIVRSNGAISQRVKETRLMQSARGKVNEKSDSVLEPGAKSTLLKLVGVKKEQIMIDKPTKSLGGAESLELSRIEELVSKHEVEKGKICDESEDEEEIVVSIIEADIENCPKIEDEYSDDV